MNPSNELSSEKTEANKVESKGIFNNLKSDYFLQKLFYNLLKKKSLDIIKYNKKIKERINISIISIGSYYFFIFHLRIVFFCFLSYYFFF